MFYSIVVIRFLTEITMPATKRISELTFTFPTQTNKTDKQHKDRVQHARMRAG